MNSYRWRSSSIYQVGIIFSAFGIFLLVAGIFIGWIVPWASNTISALQMFHTPLSISNHFIDINAFLGAYITALAVIMAVLIGYNTSTLQIAGQLHSPALIRAILFSLAPFLICWSLTTYVALMYFIVPPTLTTQLIQLLLWFGAVVSLMIGYLWNLPWRLSGEHAALWSIRQLRKIPMNQWESADGYAILQTGIVSAVIRSDLGTVRSMTLIIGDFLSSTYQESSNHFDRERYRAVKNLLSGCMQNVASAPNSVAFQLGIVTAGALLQGVAVGIAYDPERDFFSGVFRALRNEPGRLDPLWTGIRHGLCRKETHGDPYLLRYWRFHRSWDADDPRRIQFIAEMLTRFHMRCWRELAIGYHRERNSANTSLNGVVSSDVHASLWNVEEVNSEAAGMLADLYRDIALYLNPEVAHCSQSDDYTSLIDLPMKLLESIHSLVIQMWPASEAEKARVAVLKAFEERKGEMKATFIQPLSY